MRTNLPVTNVEHSLEENATLVSTTDLDSRITYANPSFVEISGFSEEELIGTPHNLVRHPDMPPEAFADLWATIRSGRSWTALVKNRCKNGDYYWVKANVTPLIENDQPVGYMSVRVKPSREEIAAASKLYQEIRSGQSRHTIRYGVVVRKGLLGKLAFWRSTGITTKLWLVMLILGLSVVGIEAIACGWSAASAAGFDSRRFLTGAVASLVVIGLVGVWLQRSLIRPLQIILDTARRTASGDLRGQVSVSRNDELGRVLRVLNQTNVNLMGLVGDVRQQTHEIKDEIEEMSEGVKELSARTESQASSLEETAASMQQLHATVQQTADLAEQANQVTSSASVIAERSGGVVGQVASNMADINARSTKIADIISVIDDIAFQTNILALNAAVEAARAGEQGRGFAVVASEVRNLAQKTAVAAKEIKGLIADSLNAVQSGTQLSGEASKTMDEVVTAVKRVSTIMAQINQATREQASGISQVNEAAMQIDRTTQENAAFAERITSAATYLASRADVLTGAVNVFKTG
ncbi:MAG: PAS domain-containing protein [Gammaproteobacteria bacterium]|nr:PAS domain-containing protein [Gammaproteobacteria bacterium]MCP5196186.1 PAS domain-containing protein [Gammaproteobacteria bacterium]